MSADAENARNAESRGETERKNESSAPAETEPLSLLQPGQRGKICAIELPGSMRGRVMEMGFTVGTVIEVVRFAPMGDPMELKVRGAHISLRKAEAAGIRVQRVSI